jgi:hypothetical protein
MMWEHVLFKNMYVMANRMLLHADATINTLATMLLIGRIPQG